jgi:hypothetical protein
MYCLHSHVDREPVHSTFPRHATVLVGSRPPGFDRELRIAGGVQDRPPAERGSRTALEQAIAANKPKRGRTVPARLPALVVAVAVAVSSPDRGPGVSAADIARAGFRRTGRRLPARSTHRRRRATAVRRPRPVRRAVQERRGRTGQCAVDRRARPRALLRPVPLTTDPLQAVRPAGKGQWAGAPWDETGGFRAKQFSAGCVFSASGRSSNSIVGLTTWQGTSATTLQPSPTRCVRGREAVR